MSRSETSTVLFLCIPAVYFSLTLKFNSFKFFQLFQQEQNENKDFYIYIHYFSLCFGLLLFSFGTYFLRQCTLQQLQLLNQRDTQLDPRVICTSWNATGEYLDPSFGASI